MEINIRLLLYQKPAQIIITFEICIYKFDKHIKFEHNDYSNQYRPGIRNYTDSITSIYFYYISREYVRRKIISALVAIFNRVGLQTNVDKTVSMACQPCRAGSDNRTAEGYRRRITGEGKSFRERQRERVTCGECGAEIAVGSLSSHLMTRHGKAAPRRHLWAPQTTGGPRTCILLSY